MKIKDNIFRAYDIRGLYPSEVNIEFAKRLGRAVIYFFSKKYKSRGKNLNLVVGSDTRATSPVLKRALIESLISCGANIIDIGEVTTPLFYYSVKKAKSSGGIMVTASHNPPSYNGFKINGPNLEIIAGKDFVRIKKIMRLKTKIRSTRFGQISPADFKKDYIAFLVKQSKISKKINAVIDACGGTTALLLPEVLSKMPIKYKPLYFEIDRMFKKHSPNPLLAESKKPIQDEAKRGGYQLGAVFDGDGDRVFFVDEKGNLVYGHQIIALLTKELLKKRARPTVAYDLTLSRALGEFIALHGRGIKTKVGRSFLGKALSEGAVLGGESSGHFYFDEFFKRDSGILAFLKIAKIISAAKMPFSRLVAPFQKYFQSEEINFKVKNKEQTMKFVEEALKNSRPRPKISRLDGLGIAFEDLWFNLRPSNTEPVLRLNLEAKTGWLVKEKTKLLRKIIRRSR